MLITELFKNCIHHGQDTWIINPKFFAPFNEIFQRNPKNGQRLRAEFSLPIQGVVEKKTSALKILKTHLEYLTDLVSQVGIVFRLVEIAYGNQYPRLEVFSTKESIIVSII